MSFMWITYDCSPLLIRYNRDMNFAVMTFNMDFNKAIKRIGGLVEEHHPDIMCLQEINTSRENLAEIEELGYELCDYANSRVKWDNIFGVATFIKNPKIKHVETDSINLPSGIVEVVDFLLNGGRRQRTVLSSLLTIGNTQLRLINIHLSPYTTNHLRDKQIHETFDHLQLRNEPTIVLGDFNYPYHRSKFERIFKEYNLTEATTNIRSTFQSTIPFLPFKFKLDYVLFKGVQHVITERIEGRYSDHMPLISKFSLES